MKKYCFFFFLSCFCIITTRAQKIKFPESFKSANGLFYEPLLNPLPENPQTKGFKENPGLIIDTIVLKRLQSDYVKKGIEAIYYEYYGNDNKATSALHVIKYRSKKTLRKALKELKPSEREARLWVGLYIITARILKDNKRAEQIDKIVKFYKNKLNAKLYLNTQKFEPEPKEPSRE